MFLGRVPSKYDSIKFLPMRVLPILVVPKFEHMKGRADLDVSEPQVEPAIAAAVDFETAVCPLPATLRDRARKARKTAGRWQRCHPSG